jgi:segregation and condensation protein A
MAQDAPDFESALEAYPIRLQHFEGPLDLLIHLIKKNEVNIYDIPIALITHQYLEYLSLMQELNLDLAGEFLVMAATLIHIKSRMLIPRPTPEVDGELDEEDPREALVRRLLEHQKFKAAAELLHERETLRSAQHRRPDAAVAEAAGEEQEPELEVDLFSLLAAFRGVLERAKSRPRVVLPPEQMSIEQRIEQLLERLSETEAVGFEELFADANTRGRADRHVPRAARDDPAEADPRVPVGQLRAHPRLQAVAPGGRAAPDSRSRAGVRRTPPGQGRGTRTKDEGRRTKDEGRRTKDEGTD